MPERKKSVLGNRAHRAEKSATVRWPSFWSISRYNLFMKCPRAYYLQHVEKHPLGKFQANAAMERGIEIHKKGERFLLGSIKQVPPEYKFFKDEMLQSRKLGAKPEEDWAMDNKWRPCSGTDWDRAWVRIKTDMHLLLPKDKSLTIVDFKTGRKYGDHTDAMELYAIGGFIRYPEARVVTAELWYLDQDDIHPMEFKRSMLTKLRNKWQKNSEKMLSARTHKETPSDAACKWCPFRSDKGGPCHGWKEA